MNTLSLRTRRFTRIFAFASALVALCPHFTLAEASGTGGNPLPPPTLTVVTSTGTTIAATGVAVQPDGSSTYTNATITYASGGSYAALWANVSTSGAILYSDGTKGHL